MRTVVPDGTQGYSPGEQAKAPAGENLPPYSVLEDITKPWRLPPQRTYLFKQVNVIDPAMGEVLPNMSVKISAGCIDHLGDTDTVPPSFEIETRPVVVNLNGAFLCPGLIDCHVHISAVPGSSSLADAVALPDPAVSLLRQPFVCRQILNRGFTTVRDTGGATLALKEAIADGVFPGPRLFIAGQALSQTGGHGDTRGAHDVGRSCACGCARTSQGQMSVVCDGVPQCVRAVREQLRRGADFIKVMAGGGVASPRDQLDSLQFTRDEMSAICQVARSSGASVTAHAYTPEAIDHAIRSGVTGIEHGNMIDEQIASRMSERGVFLTPTLVAYEAMASRRYAGFLPPESRKKNEQVLARGLQSLKLAARHGVTMCYGSDLLGPLMREQSREFGIRAQVLSNLQVLQSATVNAAKMLRQESFLGQIKKGFAADMLILSNNPLEDVTVLADPEKCILAVIKDGRIYSSRLNELPEDA